MKVLVADDDLFSRRVLEGVLRSWGWDVTAVSDGRAAWDVLRGEDPPRMAILDWEMPGLDGPGICRLVRGRDSGPYIYMIVLTARSSRADIVAALEAGADDFVQKAFEPAELRVRVRAGARILDLETRLTEQATRDALTGVYNRGAGLDLLQRELARAERETRPVSVLMVDIDHFKAINDTWGHPAGDAALQETAARLGGSLRGYDVLLRYGGEEFAIVLPGCDAAAAVSAAERCRLDLAAEPVAVGAAEIPVTASVGVATLGVGDTMERLLDRADRALYRAKRLGRNRVEVALGPAAGAVA